MIIFAIILNIVLVLIDQLTKRYAVTNFKSLEETVPVINGVLDFTYLENKGAAFGFMPGGRIFFIIFTVIVLCGIIYYFVKLPKTKINFYIKISLILISSGAIGNLIDRALNGFVVDFIKATVIKFMDFPIFNVADIYVVVGTVMLSIILIFFVKEDEEVI